MKKTLLPFLFLLFFSLSIVAQQPVLVGKGSYAESPPESVWDEDGYFAKPYRWFKDNYSSIYLHHSARNKPVPTNKWWTNYIFSQYGGEAWAYPHAVSADKEGINVKIPDGFRDGNMVTSPYLSIKGSSRLLSEEEAALFADFESTTYPAGWTVGANPAFPGPISLADISQTPTPNGFGGNRFVNSFRGNEAKLSLTSPSFIISKNFIHLSVGGGNYINDTYVGLFINGNRIFAETGENSGNLTKRMWDVSAYIGQTAEIRIVDNSSAGWGFIMCDDIVFSNSSYGGTGYPVDFSPRNSNVTDWNDIGFSFRSEDADGRYMNVSLMHGIPFTWITLHNLVPILKPGASAKVYNLSGTEITNFPYQTHVLTIEFDGRIYGVHSPGGSKIHRSKGGDFQIEIPENAARYLVISALPSRSLLALYDEYARNEPQSGKFTWNYNAQDGKITTTFSLETVHLDNQSTSGETLMSFLPHHYRNTQTNFNFITGAEYRLIKGRMQTAAGKQFSIEYNFTGLLPYMPEPLNLSSTQQERLANLITERAKVSAGFNGNTYAKGLGEESNVMLMAKETNHPAFVTLKNNLKAELQDWFTYSPSEASSKQYFFTNYPDYGAIIGFPPGYGSQGFNDLHFHNGYFVTGAARLMAVDKDFKRDYGEMAKIIAKSYANWKHYPEGNMYLPFLRTFDPYFGHSFAGGTGDGGGNNQESTSEAIHSWFGVYLLGIELNDPEITALGAMGFLLETTATNEYWLDMYDENFPETYKHDYVGILRTGNLAWATYFSGDPAWMLGIQGVPVDFFYNAYMGKKPAKMKSIWESMLSDRTTVTNPPINTTLPYENILDMGSYLGGYHLNLMNTFDPKMAALFTDSLYSLGGSWAQDANMAAQYYVSNAILTYGKPAEGYHTSIPSGVVYKNAAGELTYLLYNPSSSDVDVNIYQHGQIIETVKVAAGKYYNSRMIGGINPVVTITSHQNNAKLALNKQISMTAVANDKDGTVKSVEFFLGNDSIGISYMEPFQIKFKPTTPGIYNLRAIATDDQGNKSEPYTIQIEVLSVEQTSYIRRPWNIPSEKILAVQFDHGGQGISYQDREIEILGGNRLRENTGVETEDSNNGDGNIGWTESGEWQEYTVNVETAGVYAFTPRLSSAYGGIIRVEFDGVNKTGSLDIHPTGSWGAYQDMTVANIPLKAGVQIMRIFIEKAGMNLSSYRFALTNEKMAPEANAGADQVIFLPGAAATLSGTAQAFAGSKIVKYEWSQLDSYPPVNFSNPLSATTQIRGLQAGTYQFQLTVTDDNDLSASGTVVVWVRPENYPPIANPGASRSISSTLSEFTLDASKSYDPDGTIEKYTWEQIDSNNPLTINQTNLASPTAKITGFQPGNLYILKLTVTDNSGLTAYESVRIFVEGTTAVASVKDAEITVYPNPFENQLNVHTGEVIIKKARIFSTTGMLLLEKNIDNQTAFTIDTQGLSQGLYLLTLQSENELITKRILKK